MRGQKFRPHHNDPPHGIERRVSHLESNVATLIEGQKHQSGQLDAIGRKIDLISPIAARSGTMSATTIVAIISVFIGASGVALTATAVVLTIVMAVGSMGAYHFNALIERNTSEIGAFDARIQREMRDLDQITTKELDGLTENLDEVESDLDRLRDRVDVIGERSAVNATKQ